MQPTAQAVGKKWNKRKPRRGERTVATQSLKAPSYWRLNAALKRRSSTKPALRGAEAALPQPCPAAGALPTRLTLAQGRIIAVFETACPDRSQRVGFYGLSRFSSFPDSGGPLWPENTW